MEYTSSVRDWASSDTAAEAGSSRLRNGWKIVAVALLLVFVIADLLAAAYLLRPRPGARAAVAPGGTLSVPRLRYLPWAETTEFEVSNSTGTQSLWLVLARTADTSLKD
ncbi:MAG TPA: hypothetical protein VNF73_08485 [Candidatus Saccharimonadales bacterium]|nr:hypothetical protein [Candidatus Saccharimonadales bacterium]